MNPDALCRTAADALAKLRRDGGPEVDPRTVVVKKSFERASASRDVLDRAAREAATEPEFFVAEGGHGACAITRAASDQLVQLGATDERGPL